MKKKCRGKEKKNENKRNAFSLQEKEAVLVAFRISKLTRVKEFRTLETDRELSYISPALWYIKKLRTSSAIRMHPECHQKTYY